MTLLEPPKPAFPLLAVLRIPVNHSAADNFDLGGLAAPVNMETGICGSAIMKRGQYPLPRFDKNPLSGAIIKGQRLPFWHETVAAACEAHNLLGASIPIIGWDIAVLEDGPLFIEMNRRSCNDLAQLPSGTPLGGTAYASCLLSCLRKAFNVP